MIRLERQGYPTRDLVVLPGARQAEMVAHAHADRLGAHHKIEKTGQRLLEYCWWPGLWSECASQIHNCSTCKFLEKKSTKSNTFLMPHPQATAPLETCFFDLKGPLMDKFGRKSYILLNTHYLGKLMIKNQKQWPNAFLIIDITKHPYTY